MEAAPFSSRGLGRPVKRVCFDADLAVSLPQDEVSQGPSSGDAQTPRGRWPGLQGAGPPVFPLGLPALCPPPGVSRPRLQAPRPRGRPRSSLTKARASTWCPAVDRGSLCRSSRPGRDARGAPPPSVALLGARLLARPYAGAGGLATTGAGAGTQGCSQHPRAP